MIMHSQDSLKAGAVAKAAGVGVQTLHYYERLGLLQKPNRSAANYRLYAPEAVRRVRFIKKAQALGLTLESRAAARLSPCACASGQRVAEEKPFRAALRWRILRSDRANPVSENYFKNPLTLYQARGSSVPA